MYFYIYSRKLKLVTLWILAAMLLWALMRMLMIARHEKAWTRINRVLVILSTAAILWATLFRTQGGPRTITWDPFIKWTWIGHQPEYKREMLMNVLLFLPLGLSLAHGLPCRRSVWLRILFVCAVCLAVSATVELTQFAAGCGSAETNDMLCNTGGALLGAVTLLPGELVRLLLRRRAKKKKRS